MPEPVTLRAGRPEDVGMDPRRIALIRERAQGWVHSGDCPSLVILAARRGVVVLEEAFGILRPSDAAPLGTDAIFPIMSITKPITATAILCLVEDGLLSLKHPITDLIPELKAPGAEQVLIADLLTHTSGYDDMSVYPHVTPRFAEKMPVPSAAPNQRNVTNRLIHYAGDAALTRAPGEALCYCNFGFTLLGDIVRRASGMSFPRFVAERIFAPLGMHDSFFVLPDALRETRRVLRNPKCPDLPVLYPGFPPELFPSANSEAWDASEDGAGGVKATAHDLAVFAHMLLNGGTYDGQRILSRASVAAMTSPQLPAGLPRLFSVQDPDTGVPQAFPVRGGSYGYGLFVLTPDDRTAYFNGSLQSGSSFGHTGHIASCFWVDPENEVVGVCLSVPSALRPLGSPVWYGDKFQNMVHAAIVD